MTELPCGLRCVLNMLNFGTAQQNYKKHQKECEKCAEVCYKKLRHHVKFHVMLPCGRKRDVLQRADYNAHRFKCVKCRQVAFRFVKTTFHKMQRRHQVHSRKLGNLKHALELFEVGQVNFFDHAYGEFRISDGKQSYFFHHAGSLRSLPVLPCSKFQVLPHVQEQAPFGFPHKDRTVVDLSADTYDMSFSCTTFTTTYIPQITWLLFRRNYEHELRKDRRENLPFACHETSLPACAVNLIADYDMSNYDVLCSLVFCLIALWSDNTKKLQECCVPLLLNVVRTRSMDLQLFFERFNVLCWVAKKSKK
jgi:hypothetical protein